MLVLTAEERIVKKIEKRGGKVTRDDKLPGNPVVKVNLTGPKVTDTALKELKQLKSLQELYLFRAKVTDVGLKELKEIKSLQSLNLDDTNPNRLASLH